MKLFSNSSPNGTLDRLKKALTSVEYGPTFLRENYSYFNSLSASSETVNVIPLAAFAQDIPSYRNACIGVTIASDLSGADNAVLHRALGAPIIFELYSDEIVLWKINSLEPPEVMDRFGVELLETRFGENVLNWSPRRIFEAKTAGLQLDFVDLGLMPVIESSIKYKLDELLQRTLKEIADVHQAVTGAMPKDEDLFRFVFRFIAAKVLRDRNEPGGWNSNDAFEVLSAIEQYYGVGDDKLPASTIQVHQTIEIAWAIISTAFHFENLSVYHLAYIWENTLVTRAKRKKYGIHSTPPHIAEYVVQKLPIEVLEANTRRVLEPCSGHGIFLLFAMQRLRDLLPADISHTERHLYLKERLTGLEVDLFAREVSRICLMLADYPNPNGWHIYPDDIFATRRLEAELLTADIVLCNPPFGKFSSQERANYPDVEANFQKPAELLNRVLASPPSLLGFVLPKTFITGSSYKWATRQLANSFRSIEMIALPDNVFNHADQETVLLMAWDRSVKNEVVSVTGSVVTEGAYEAFRDLGQVPLAVTKDRKVPPKKSAPFSLWVSNLEALWEFLASSEKLSDVAKIRRGIQWKPGVDRSAVISKVEVEGWRRGYISTRGRLRQYALGSHAYINPDPSNMMFNPMEYDWDNSKVFMNANASSRRAWRLSAVTDVEGALATQAFHIAFPKSSKTTPELITAVLNGLVANAWAYSWSDKRHNKIDILEKIPFPTFNTIDQQIVEDKVGKLEDLLSSEDILQTPIASLLEHLLLQVDAAVLLAYGLTDELEDQLVSTFYEGVRPLPFSSGGFDREAYQIAKAKIIEERQQRKMIIQYHELADRLLMKQITDEERAEIDRLGQEIDTFDAPFYERILERLQENQKR
jgi:hypothetical protein